MRSTFQHKNIFGNQQEKGPNFSGTWARSRTCPWGGPLGALSVLEEESRFIFFVSNKKIKAKKDYPGQNKHIQNGLKSYPYWLPRPSPTGRSPRPTSKALRYKLFSVKALSARLRKLTKLTKRLIAIIIVSFVIAKINENQRLNNRDYGNSEF